MLPRIQSLVRRVRGNTRQEILLDQHTEASLVGDDEVMREIEEHPEVTPELRGMFRLTKRLAAAFVPVEPATQFVQDLKGKLAEMQRKQAASVTVWSKRRVRARQISRVLSTFISAVAIVALVARVIGSIVLLIAYLVGRRKTAATI